MVMPKILLTLLVLIFVLWIIVEFFCKDDRKQEDYSEKDNSLFSKKNKSKLNPPPRPVKKIGGMTEEEKKEFTNKIWEEYHCRQIHK